MGYKYSDITGAVIGSAMKVHSALGSYINSNFKSVQAD